MAPAGTSTILLSDSINSPATNAMESVRSSVQEQNVDLGVDKIGGQNDEGGSIVTSDVDYDPDASPEEILQTSFIMLHSPRKQVAIIRLFEKAKTAVRNALSRKLPSP
ncbi:hypothetical protein PHLGIDRAFT_116911 [Phlebiopsis gigantea 11061_1 CR5-6]|uniref:Uncharacterized protein n=1 Tax=Phlebiopsis gigantea (strain 11061_1 CR5-6) TaxID=745531 RepID=A0A0C3NTZ9_PHLG1|nr:hypothetical protein PHLGIDRAFT_116911 [Phlebiopsis gigantea 11061_1 CR5-6]